MQNNRKLKAGEWVRVRTKDEILRTLDRNGQLDGMPFMPEMFEICGKTLQVYRRAHKTCDTVFPIRGRRVERAVHLETRCDGSAHGGCQAGCLIFWKEAWLERLDRAKAIPPSGPAEPNADLPGGRANECTESDVRARAKKFQSGDDPICYVCQATQLPYATGPLAWWDLRQYLEDFTSGNVRLRRLLSGLVYSTYYHLSEAGIGLGRPLRWVYDKLHTLWKGPPFPRRTGTIPEGQPTPTVTLNLQPGELVRVKPYERILETLSTTSRNRGMFFDAEMVPYCGEAHRVLRRVTRIIDEKTGRMQEMKSPCIILESVTCQARYSECRMFCPRGIYPYWREIWLERITPQAAGTGSSMSGARDELHRDPPSP